MYRVRAAQAAQSYDVEEKARVIRSSCTNSLKAWSLPIESLAESFEKPRKICLLAETLKYGDAIDLTRQGSNALQKQEALKHRT
jgi:hypothetical protein